MFQKVQLPPAIIVVPQSLPVQREDSKLVESDRTSQLQERVNPGDVAALQRQANPLTNLEATAAYHSNDNGENTFARVSKENDPANVIGKTVGGKYAVEEFIAPGGMSYVYKAVTQEGKKIALKVMKVLSTGAFDPTLLKRFVREGQTMNKLSHPNVLPIYDAGEDKGTQYIAMEFIDGGTLASRKDSLSLNEKLLIMADVCEALKYVHDRGIVHRDLKPANILLKNELTNGKYPPHPLAVVADFGLNLDMNESRISEHSNELTGTAYYMAPEDRKTKLSDLYSTGVVLYELVTGVVPFKGKDFPSTIIMHRTEKPVSPNVRIEQLNKELAVEQGVSYSPIPKISPRLETLIMSLLKRDPENRSFRDAGQVATELRSIVMPPPQSKLKIPILL